MLMSWAQLLVLLALFIMLPILINVGVHGLESRINVIRKKKAEVLLMANLFTFLCLISYATNYLNKKMLLLFLGLALILGMYFSRYVKTVVKFQFLLAIIGFVFFIPTIKNYLTYSSNWKAHNDAIANTKFKSKPNIYFIQPDGYIGSSEIRKGHYKEDAYSFDSVLIDKGFKIYPRFRGNYFSTLSANSAIFSMKHHYYNSIADVNSEMLWARNNIMGENTVLSVLKNNGYTTHAILESPYLIVSRPELYFDDCNISYDEVPYLSKGFDIKKNVIGDLKSQLQSNNDGGHFYFIENILPGHIANLKSNSKGEEQERLDYFNNIDAANTWLKEIIDLIDGYDDNALIVIAADHGGFVGFEYSSEAHNRTEDMSDLNSIFSTLLAIKWTGEEDIYDKQLHSSVNLFRVVFSFLSSDTQLLNHLEDNSSYLTIDKGAPLGIYKVIDNNGNAIFEEH